MILKNTKKLGAEYWWINPDGMLGWHPKCDTVLRVFERQWNGWCFAHYWEHANGNRNFPYLNRDNRKRYVNLTWMNRLNPRWNDNWGFFLSR